MTFFLVRQTDRRTDTSRRIRAHRAWAQVGSKSLSPALRFTYKPPSCKSCGIQKFYLVWLMYAGGSNIDETNTNCVVMPVENLEERGALTLVMVSGVITKGVRIFISASAYRHFFLNIGYRQTFSVLTLPIFEYRHLETYPIQYMKSSHMKISILAYQ